jgi:hypothetical protein
MAALISTCAYLSNIDLSGLHYWRRDGSAVAFIALPALVPYIVSGGYAYRRVNAHRGRLVIFLSTLIAGAALTTALFVGLIGPSLDVPDLIDLIFVECLVHPACALMILRPDSR